MFEIRTGEGLQPIYRTGKTPAGTLDAVENEIRAVLTQAFGKDGEAKRERALEMKKAILHAWSEQGPSKLEFDNMLAMISE